MKGLGIFLLLVGIVFGVVFWGKSKNNEMLTQENVSNMEGEPLPGAQNTPVETVLQGTKEINTYTSNVSWSGSKKVVKNWVDTGTISIKQGFANFSNGDLTGGEVILDMTTIKATSTGKGDGQDFLSTHLKSDDFFAVATYPESRFVITSVSKESGDIYKITGDLTIKNKTNSISFPAEVKNSNGISTISGGLVLDRTLWDVKFGSDKFFQSLGDNVINDEFSLNFTISTR